MKRTQKKTKLIATLIFFVALCDSSMAFSVPLQTTPMEANSASKDITRKTSAHSIPSTMISVTQLQPRDDLGTSQGKRLSIVAALEYGQKIAIEERGERESSTDFALAISYKISDLTSLTTKAVLSKDNVAQKNTTLSNTTLILNIKGYTFNDRLTSAHSITGVVPTSEQSQYQDRLQTALSISNGLTYLIPAIRVDYRLGINRNFHELNVNANGKPNIEFTLTNSLALEVPVFGNLSFITSGAYKNARTYKNFDRSSFIFTAGLNYDVTDTFGVSAGMSNDGNARKANGVDSNIAVYDAKTSVISVGLAYIY